MDSPFWVSVCAAVDGAERCPMPDPNRTPLRGISYLQMRAEWGLWRRCRGRIGRNWHAEETYIEVAGRCCYVYRAIDSAGALVGVLFSERRDMAAAKAFLPQTAPPPPHHDRAGPPRSHVRRGRNAPRARAILAGASADRTLQAATLTPGLPRLGRLVQSGATVAFTTDESVPGRYLVRHARRASRAIVCI
jgi:hypothetical protein